MIVTKVVDASALAALLFGEAEEELVRAQLRGARLFAPPIIEYELANVCIKKVKLNPERQSTIIAAYHFRERMDITLMPIDHNDNLDLAIETGLTIYDASYLYLARQLGADLVSFDKQLIKAFGSH